MAKMSVVERIELKGEVYALILRRELNVEGVNFFTTPDNPLQLGILQHGKGTEIKPHVHRNTLRTIENVQEVLYIEYGKVETSFYNKNGEKVGSSVLNTGDTILLLNGGHGFRILKDARILEVKQGPYRGVENDKVVLD